MRISSTLSVVAGCRDGSLRVWDAATGAAIGALAAAHDAPVIGVATTEIAGRPVVISGDDQCVVRTHWLDTGAPFGPEVRGAEEPAVAWLDGRVTVVAADQDQHDRLCVWDAATGRSVAASRHPLGWVSALTVAVVDARTFVVIGDSDGRVAVVDPADGGVTAGMDGGHDRSVGAIATADVDGAPMVVTTGLDGTVRRWRLSGAPVGAPLRGHRGPFHGPAPVYALTTVELDGRPVAVSSGWDGELRLWDLAHGRQIGAPLDDYHGDVQALVGGHIDGRPAVAAGGIDDPLLRVWDLDRKVLLREIETESDVLALAPVPPAGMGRLLSPSGAP